MPDTRTIRGPQHVLLEIAVADARDVSNTQSFLSPRWFNEPIHSFSFRSFHVFLLIPRPSPTPWSSYCSTSVSHSQPHVMRSFVHVPISFTREYPDNFISLIFSLHNTDSYNVYFLQFVCETSYYTYVHMTRRVGNRYVENSLDETSFSPPRKHFLLEDAKIKFIRGELRVFHGLWMHVEKIEARSLITGVIVWLDGDIAEYMIEERIRSACLKWQCWLIETRRNYILIVWKITL